MTKRVTLVLEDGSVYEGYSFGAKAAEKRISCFTSLDTAQAAVETFVNRSQTYSAQPLSDYRRKKRT
ncbi:hypothetical protein ACFLWD_03565 [Chloroflexota bacterium]